MCPLFGLRARSSAAATASTGVGWVGLVPSLCGRLSLTTFQPSTDFMCFHLETAETILAFLLDFFLPSCIMNRHVKKVV